MDRVGPGGHFLDTGQTLERFRDFWFPGLLDRKRRPEWLKGLASVVSCELKSPSLEKVGNFFDAPLPGVLKAPSLGSNQTLFCPYVLLAYYDKSDEYLKECNLSKTLLRFAAGCEEDFSEVLAGIQQALDLLR